MPKNKIARAVLLAVLGCSAGIAQAQSCEPERYFDPRDVDNSSALAKPHAEFRTTHARAKRGVAAEERNLAVYYESGYLVSACPEKAAYWYARAAEHGDEVAKAWMVRRASMEDVRSKLECFGDACLAAPAGSVQKTVLQSGPGGAYTAAVTINGRTLQGIVDTGATYVSMSSRTANELGITYASGRKIQLRTANGIAPGRAIVLGSVRVGNITLERVEAVVGEADHPLLIGMSFLSRVTISSNGSGLTLVKP